jgi:hypothetical protein
MMSSFRAITLAQISDPFGDVILLRGCHFLNILRK